MPNFVLAGCFTAQRYLGSMEGAILAGKLAAEVIVDSAAGNMSPEYQLRAIDSSVPRECEERVPAGVRGTYPIAFGGGQEGVGGSPYHP